MAGVSNADLMNKLMEMSEKQAVMDLKIDRVEAQANKTNGRVTKAEEFINALKAVEHYKKENPTQTIVAPNATTVVANQPQKWFQNEKVVATLALVGAAVASVLSFLAGGATK